MPELASIASLIKDRGFTCKRCGLCCHDTEGSGLVMVGPREVRAIMAGTGRTWRDVAEPYPVFLEGPGGCIYTFEWALKRDHGHCVFLEGTHCSIYATRPWICRTYPFMLDGDELRISECSGLGGETATTDAVVIAGDLIRRQTEEWVEEARIAGHRGALHAYPGRRIVIDSEGVKTIDP